MLAWKSCLASINKLNVARSDLAVVLVSGIGVTRNGAGGGVLPEMGHQMLEWARELFPYPRSLTGPGTRKTIKFLQDLNPELQTVAVKTGFSVFDWEVPQEWRIREAFIEHVESGKRFAEFSKLNLHIVGYSEPINTIMPLQELNQRIHTQPDQPDWVPYVSSYYKRYWGFCMSENDRAALPEGEYHVVIDSELFDGEMILANAVIPGELSEEIFFSSYICHPSMANNELSGPVMVSALLRFLKEQFPKPKYSYRFVLAPETIGALTYLQENLGHLKENTICGFNLSCVGDERAYSHIESRLGNTLADEALESAFVGLPNPKKYSFLQRASDERQYCAPGIDLPMVGYCRTKYMEYPEYHTSADNFDVVTAAGLQGSFDLLTTIIRSFELGLYPRTTVLGEPQLGKRGLYPTTSQKGSYANVRARMDALAYSDGNHSLFEIAKKIRRPLSEVVAEIQLLARHGLISLEDSAR